MSSWRGGVRDGGWMGEGRPKGGHALAILPGCQPGTATAVVTAGAATAVNAHISCPP